MNPLQGPYVVRTDERGAALYIVAAADRFGFPTVCELPRLPRETSALPHLAKLHQEGQGRINATAQLLAASWEMAEAIRGLFARLDAAGLGTTFLPSKEAQALRDALKKATEQL